MHQLGHCVPSDWFKMTYTFPVTGFLKILTEFVCTLQPKLCLYLIVLRSQ